MKSNLLPLILSISLASCFSGGNETPSDFFGNQAPANGTPQPPPAPPTTLPPAAPPPESPPAATSQEDAVGAGENGRLRPAPPGTALPPARKDPVLAELDWAPSLKRLQGPAAETARVEEGTVTFEADVNLVDGDVFQFQDRFAFKAISVARTNGQTIVKVASPKLQEVVRSARFVGEYDVTAEDIVLNPELFSLGEPDLNFRVPDEDPAPSASKAGALKGACKVDDIGLEAQDGEVGIGASIVCSEAKLDSGLALKLDALVSASYSGEINFLGSQPTDAVFKVALSPTATVRILSKDFTKEPEAGEGVCNSNIEKSSTIAGGRRVLLFTQTIRTTVPGVTFKIPFCASFSLSSSAAFDLVTVEADYDVTWEPAKGTPVVDGSPNVTIPSKGGRVGKWETIDGQEQTSIALKRIRAEAQLSMGPETAIELDLYSLINAGVAVAIAVQGEATASMEAFAINDIFRGREVLPSLCAKGEAGITATVKAYADFLAGGSDKPPTSSPATYSFPKKQLSLGVCSCGDGSVVLATGLCPMLFQSEILTTDHQRTPPIKVTRQGNEDAFLFCNGTAESNGNRADPAVGTQVTTKLLFEVDPRSNNLIFKNDLGDEIQGTFDRATRTYRFSQSSPRAISESKGDVRYETDGSVAFEGTLQANRNTIEGVLTTRDNVYWNLDDRVARCVLTQKITAQRLK